MHVRAKFYVGEKKINANQPHQGADPIFNQSTSVVMYPVTSGSDENKAFFKASPSGKFEINIINQAAADQLEIGKSYYIDITPAN